MGKLRTPLFVIAIVLSLMAVLVEGGSPWLLPAEAGVALGGVLADSQDELPEDSDIDVGDLEKLREDQPTPPGLGIPTMAFLDGLVFFTVALMGAALLIPERVHGRVQGIVSLIVSFLVLLAVIVAILKALAKLILMVSLFLSAPFGTIAYLAIYGFFPKGAAATALGLLMTLKLAFAACLVLAHQRFLQNKGLVLILLTSLLANIIVAFLHGFVPVFLVSITDALAALIVGILAALWALVLLISSLVSIIKVLRVDRSS